MSDKIILCSAACLVVGAVLGAVVGSKWSQIQEHNNAMKMGFGYHWINPYTGDKDFVYGPIPEPLYRMSEKQD